VIRFLFVFIGLRSVWGSPEPSRDGAGLVCPDLWAGSLGLLTWRFWGGWHCPWVWALVGLEGCGAIGLFDTFSQR